MEAGTPFFVHGPSWRRGADTELNRFPGKSRSQAQAWASFLHRDRRHPNSDAAKPPSHPEANLPLLDISFPPGFSSKRYRQYGTGERGPGWGACQKVRRQSMDEAAIRNEWHNYFYFEDPTGPNQDREGLEDLPQTGGPDLPSQGRARRYRVCFPDVLLSLPNAFFPEVVRQSLIYRCLLHPFQTRSANNALHSTAECSLRLDASDLRRRRT